MARRLRGAVLAIGALAACFALAGCGTSAPGTAPTSAPHSQAPSSPSSGTTDPTPSSTPVAAQLVPAGTARENLAYFNQVNKAFLGAQASAGGRAIIDNLVTAGFDKSAMQVTPDKTVNGHPADSIQFSVLLGDECLIGQSSGGSYGSVVAPALGTGQCLIGKTRQITW